MLKKKKRLIGYASLKDACMDARNEAIRKNCSRWNPVNIFVEPDSSFSVGTSLTNKGKFYVAVDKSGARYRKKRIKDLGMCREVYVKI